MAKNGMRPIHPGEILKEEYLVPLGLSANAVAKALNVPPSRVGDIVLERRGITVDTALRLAQFFGGDAQSWLNLQQAYEPKVAEKTLLKEIRKEVRPHSIGGDSRLALA
ncbi:MULTISPECIES: HigA family addiction module antitoxin [unclassified Acidovorax]|uniref:HigA family addiction module antitoxin n=1 Tax=unclassified Acidovorax TaxID=2684926 RepID=UPI00070989FC|nr:MULTISPECIES: HigA family addiction module antitoxin [unclassified Acidovorax]KRC16798.1 virulence factor [Acidovorax sp. Root219]KRC30630.1 virulence factor [Acidovorax sp. Root217]